MIGVWSIALAAAFLLWLYPVGQRSLRLTFIALLAVVWAGALVLWWPKRWVRFSCCLLLGLLAAILLLPGRAANLEKLRARYLASLSAYEGTTYVWGGENRLGIDCSGLVRRGLIDAQWREGIASKNPELIRNSFALRWNDCSARALLNEHRQQTRRVLASPGIHELDHSKIRPGDFAVTADGVHVLAFLGNSTWIEADPGAGKVIRIHASDDNAWLRVPVVILRWRCLE